VLTGLRAALVVLTGLWLVLSAGLAGAAVAVKDVRLGNSADAQRIVFEFASTVSYKYFLLSDPERFVIDLTDVDAQSPALKDLPARVTGADSHLSGLRMAPNRPGVLRLVAELRQPMRPLVTAYPATSVQGARLVIDLVPGRPATATVSEAITPAAHSTSVSTPIVPGAAAQPAPEPVARVAVAAPAGVNPAPVATATPAQAAAPAPNAAAATLAPVERPASQAVAAAPDKAPEPPMAQARATKHAPARAQTRTPDVVQASLERRPAPVGRGNDTAGSRAGDGDGAYKRLVTVVIDPGHGGVDPGALGANGSREKDITLAVAKRLKARIDAQEGMRAVLTRDEDVFIPLHERVNKARRAQADLFVSIHADAYMKTTAKGSSVFVLSEKGATSAAARWLAKRENEADLIGGVDLDVKDVYLKQTLLDLSQTASIADSLKLGRAVLDELAGINELHKARVEQAGFAVLKAPDIPSILVETAFISNPDEEQRLLDEEYQERMAGAIVDGIKAYFRALPPVARARSAQKL